jgi:hypothetical protein
MKESRMTDDYERLAEKTELSYAEALALKEKFENADRSEKSALTSSTQTGGMSLHG